MSEQKVMSKSELLEQMRRGWDDFQAYLQTLSEAQLSQPTDAAGWTAKDHVIHLAVWEAGIDALLGRESRWERMGLDAATWASGDFDAMNAVIQRRHKDMPLVEVLRTFQDVHQRLIGKIALLSDEDLQRPYRAYQPDSDRDAPVIGWIMGNTYEHYAEHRPWIEAIVER